MRHLRASVTCVAITVWLVVLNQACGAEEPRNVAPEGPSRTTGLNASQIQTWSKTLDVLVASASEAAKEAGERPPIVSRGPASSPLMQQRIQAVGSLPSASNSIPQNDLTGLMQRSSMLAPSGLQHIEGVSESGSKPRWAETPILDQKQVENFSDKELEALFKNGSSEIPGFEHKNQYQFCKGHTLVNAWNGNGSGKYLACSLSPLVA